MCVTITPAAAAFISRMIRFGGGGKACGFRLSVQPGGCSGFTSDFTVEAAPQPEDTVFEQEGVRLFLPPATCELLRGHTIDFADSRLDGGLSFTKAGAAPACCGDGKHRGGTSPIVFERARGSCKQPPEAAT